MYNTKITILIIVALLAVAAAITPTPECFGKARTAICHEEFAPDLHFCLNNSRVIYDHVSTLKHLRKIFK